MALLAISTSGTVSEAQEAGGLGDINEGPSTMEQGVNSPPPTERLINDESKKWKRITCSRNRKLFFAVLCAGFVGVAIGAGIFIYVKLYEPLVRVTFHNLCSSDISVRGYTRIGDADCNPTSHAGNCPILRPGQSLSSVFAGFALNGKAFFMTWASAVINAPNSCYGQIFCTGIECSSPSRDVWNLDSQYSYSFPISFTFKQGGQIRSDCPTDIRNGCSNTADPSTCHPCLDPAYCVECRSTQGRADTCNFDIEKCPDSAWQLSFDPHGRESWCVNPDGHLAVINYQMKNPTKAECIKDAADWGWVPQCKNPSLCGDNENLVYYMFQGTRLLYVQTEDGKWAQLTPKPLDKDPYLSEFTKSLEYVTTQKSVGGKYYQAAVNDACGQQYTNQVAGEAPTYKRAEHPLRNGTMAAVTGMTRTHLSDRKGHAVTYEGDDACYWKMDGLPVMMAGNVGVACEAGSFDEVVITACAPEVDLTTLPIIKKVSPKAGDTTTCVDTNFPQPYPDPGPLPSPTPTPLPTPTPTPSPPPTTPAPAQWQTCPAGSSIPCCNPFVSPKMECPGSIPCQGCGGGSACQCPHSSASDLDAHGGDI